VLAVGAAALLIFAGHGLNFRRDEWDIIQGRYGGALGDYLRPLNEHLSLIPIVIYRALFSTVGLTHHMPYRIVLVVMNVTCGVLVFLLARKRQEPAVALLAAAVVLFLGAAYEDMLFAIQVNYVGAVIGGLGAWLALDEGPRAGRFATMMLLLSLLFAIGSSGVGLAVLVGVTGELLYRRDWRRLWVPIVIGCAYLAWYLGYGQGAEHLNLLHAPGFFVGLAAYTLVGALGLWPLYHLPHAVLIFAAIVVVGGVVSFVRYGLPRGWFGYPQTDSSGMRSPGPDRARLFGLTLCALTFWLLSSAARGSLSPYRSRYVQLGAVVLVLALVELLRGRRLPSIARVIAVAGAIGFILINAPYIVHRGAAYRDQTSIVSAELGAMQLASSNASASFHPDPALAPEVTTGRFRRAVAAIGSSPADPPARLRDRPPQARHAADLVLLRLSPRVMTFRAPSMVARDCRRRRPVATLDGPQRLYVVSRRAAVVNSSGHPIPVGLRRFGDSIIWLSPTLASGLAAVVSPETDTATPGWSLAVPLAGGIAVCDA
jgi:hypothetical protein